MTNEPCSYCYDRTLMTKELNLTDIEARIYASYAGLIGEAVVALLAQSNGEPVKVCVTVVHDEVIIERVP